MVGRSAELINELKIYNHTTLEHILLDILASSRIYICGNGGSASTAQHFESDIQNMGKDAICLDNNIARVTALTNDFGWDSIYIRQLTHMTKRDCLVIFTVHGSAGEMKSGKWSQNLAKAAEHAKFLGAKVILFSGNDGGELMKLADRSLTCHSGDVDVVEPFHAALCHEMCAVLKDYREHRTLVLKDYREHRTLDVFKFKFGDAHDIQNP